MGLSRSQLYRRLAPSDKTVHQLIQDIRMQEATRLLLNPAIRVASAGRMVGMAHSAIFTRWFRQHTGLTPPVAQQMIPGFPSATSTTQTQRNRRLGCNEAVSVSIRRIIDLGLSQVVFIRF